MRGPGDWSRQGGLLISRQKAVGRIWVGPPPEWRWGWQVHMAVCLSSAHAVREPWGRNVAVRLRRCGRPHPPPASAEVFGAGPLPGAHAQVREGVRREAEGRAGDPTLRGSLLDPIQLRVRGTGDRPRAGHPGSHLPDPQCQRQECREWSRPHWQPLSGPWAGGQAGWGSHSAWS